VAGLINLPSATGPIGRPGRDPSSTPASQFAMGGREGWAVWPPAAWLLQCDDAGQP